MNEVAKRAFLFALAATIAELDAEDDGETHKLFSENLGFHIKNVARILRESHESEMKEVEAAYQSLLETVDTYRNDLARMSHVEYAEGLLRRWSRHGQLDS